MQTRVRIKELKLTMDDHQFYGSYESLVFDFLTRMVEAFDTLSMSEAQALLVLPNY